MGLTNPSYSTYISRCRSISKKQNKKFYQTEEGQAISKIDETCKKQYIQLVLNNLCDKKQLNKIFTAISRGFHTKKKIINFDDKLIDKYYLLLMNNCSSVDRRSTENY